MVYVICPDCGKVSRLQDCKQDIDDKIDLLFKISDELQYRLSVLERLLK